MTDKTMPLNKTPKHKHRARSSDTISTKHKIAIAQAVSKRNRGAKDPTVSLAKEPWKKKIV